MYGLRVLRRFTCGNFNFGGPSERLLTGVQFGKNRRLCCLQIKPTVESNPRIKKRLGQEWSDL